MGGAGGGVGSAEVLMAALVVAAGTEALFAAAEAAGVAETVGAAEAAVRAAEAAVAATDAAAAEALAADAAAAVAATATAEAAFAAAFAAAVAKAAEAASAAGAAVVVGVGVVPGALDARPAGVATLMPGTLAALAALAAPAVGAEAAPKRLRSLIFFDSSATRVDASRAWRSRAILSSADEAVVAAPLGVVALPCTAPCDKVSLSGMVLAGVRSSTRA